MGIRARLEEEYDYDIVDEFLDHLDIMTEAMEPTIIALENEASRIEMINELFRIFHNIKSASGFLKIDRIHLLSELAEDLMESVRQNPNSLSEEIIDWLLLVNDQFRAWYTQLENDDELKDINPKILNVPEI
ncbi:Hpt domain-containing protein [Hydrogenimonas thermophila]|uniref:Two-component system, chemotaxis family, sensor kinase CheA n=1 Tax=Hydrogenimonas thermophila TaxID=223786 RepID=A0A1I5SDV2_9BACT|nr:Hpt domain-containing protein [Hydrogenimonas thermophila]WOE69474.1 Hpt domain-containing protein [Hydrogenimonas thermophila]WOE71985.1 Hpt domain-containing protein [Hydrogenimonas thermophila]SFP68931.1 two-component system, chemotaxis family, sensor kinase CheA [Hydrogenimonas thermophila]